MTASSTITLGRVEITRIEEVVSASPATPGFLFPDGDPAWWSSNASWLSPDFYDAEAGTLRTVLHSWLIRSGGQTIIVDTGAGNGKERPYAPVYGHRQSSYLENLAAAGVRPEDVDIVINTHLHVDHVGWNTRIDGREWVPTFPHARYLMPQQDLVFWDPALHPRLAGDGNQNVFEDSVAPIRRAGQIDAWDESYRIDGDLVLEAAPGHTPGSSILRVESEGDGALFVGDILHNPLQVVHPELNSCFCEDPSGARATRRRLLSEAADRRLLVFPGHFAGSSACYLDHAEPGFAITDWASFARI